MKINKIISAVMLMCIAGGVNAQASSFNGKNVITHDYSCIDVSQGEKGHMTVWEVPGSASMLTAKDSESKPTTTTLKALDDQAGATRMYKMKSPATGDVVLQIADKTNIATLIMQPFKDEEAHTTKVCKEDK